MKPVRKVPCVRVRVRVKVSVRVRVRARVRVRVRVRVSVRVRVRARVRARFVSHARDRISLGCVLYPTCNPSYKDVENIKLMSQYWIQGFQLQLVLTCALVPAVPLTMIVCKWVRVRERVRVRGLLATTSHSIFDSRVGQIAMFCHCQP